MGNSKFIIKETGIRLIASQILKTELKMILWLWNIILVKLKQETIKTD